MDVVLHQGRIIAVLPTGCMAAQAADIEIDAAGRVMLPGLFDMHDHVWRGSGGLHLAVGVTTVRDLADDNAQLQKVLQEIADGELAYPQVVPAGFIELPAELAGLLQHLPPDVQRGSLMASMKIPDEATPAVTAPP